MILQFTQANGLHGVNVATSGHIIKFGTSGSQRSLATFHLYPSEPAAMPPIHARPEGVRPDCRASLIVGSVPQSRGRWWVSFRVRETILDRTFFFDAGQDCGQDYVHLHGSAHASPRRPKRNMARMANEKTWTNAVGTLDSRTRAS